MNTNARTTAALTLAALLISPMAHAPGAQAAAASCYGDANDYRKPAGTYWHPAGDVFRTSSSCTDINIRPNTNRYVKVCFETSSGGSNCQANYTLALAGQWNVIASNVRDDVMFAFEFRSSAQSTGSWAA